MEGHHKHNTNLFFGLFRAVPLLGLPALLGIACSAALAQAAPFAYITNFRSDTVSVIATATNTVTATVPVGDRPVALGQFIGSPLPVAPVTTLCSTLGDDRPPSKGETVTLTLEARPGAPYTGERATLLLLGNIPKVFLARIDSGALPNTLLATLPATGSYLVTVAEHPNVRRGSAFLGDYCVTLESSGEAWQTFAPTGWVEGLLD